jgi:hypothetical protein
MDRPDLHTSSRGLEIFKNDGSLDINIRPKVTGISSPSPKIKRVGGFVWLYSRNHLRGFSGLGWTLGVHVVLPPWRSEYNLRQGLAAWSVCTASVRILHLNESPSPLSIHIDTSLRYLPPSFSQVKFCLRSANLSHQVSEIRSTRTRSALLVTAELWNGGLDRWLPPLL